MIDDIRPTISLWLDESPLPSLRGRSPRLDSLSILLLLFVSASFTSLEIETASEILRTSLMCRPDGQHFGRIEHRSSQEVFRNEQSFRSRLQLGLSIGHRDLPPNSR